MNIKPIQDNESIDSVEELSRLIGWTPAPEHKAKKGETAKEALQRFAEGDYSTIQLSSFERKSRRTPKKEATYTPAKPAGRQSAGNWHEDAPTEKQLSFVTKLAMERGLLAELEGDREKNHWTKGRVSKLIDRLLKLPINPQQGQQDGQHQTQAATTQKQPSTDRQSNPVAKEEGLDLSGLRGGRYAVRDSEGVVKFFQIDVVTEGNWAGWVFAKAQASDELHNLGSQRPGGTYRGKASEALALILRDEVAALALYGQELGRCGRCGRTLTDETSRQRGIGPECWSKL